MSTDVKPVTRHRFPCVSCGLSEADCMAMAGAACCKDCGDVGLTHSRQHSRVTGKWEPIPQQDQR